MNKNLILACPRMKGRELGAGCWELGKNASLRKLLLLTSSQPFIKGIEFGGNIELFWSSSFP